MREVSIKFPGRDSVLVLALAFCSGLSLLLAPGVARGQEVTASISGTVTDPSDAPVPSAKVTAKDLDRGSTWTTQANGQGFYNFPRVPVGRYEVRAENEGFQAAVQSNLQLELNQAARINFQLKIGDVSQTVEVDAAPPLLQTSATQLSTVLTSKTNEQLPLATRNYVQLTLLAPGAAHPNPASFKNGNTTGPSGRPYINGNREQSNNFLLDGVDNNQVSDNQVGYSPSVDAIQEFNMITQNASSEFGNFQGGIISTTIKSGTNQFHGGVFEFFRNDVLNANEWENNWKGLAKNKLRWNQFGGTFGGPIKKDKLFFFADYQGQRFSNPSTPSTLSVLTAAERQGDFSALLRQAKPIQLFHPVTKEKFVNNQIPLSMINPAAQALFNSSAYPLPINNNLQNNQVNIASSQINGNQGDIKIDYNVSEKDRLFGRYSRSQVENPTVNSFPLRADTLATFPTHSGVLNWTRTISPSFVNEARVGVNYVLVHNNIADLSKLGNFADELGIPGVNTRGPGLLDLRFETATFASNIGAANSEQMFANTVIQYQDTMIITKGRHVFHAGFQGMRRRINTFYAGNNGTMGFMTFDGRFSGSAESDLFLGLPRQLGRGVNTGTWGQRGNIFSAYVQDDWRISNTLTLNLGLRYELNTPWVEVNDRQVNFAPFSGELQFAGEPSIYNNDRALYNQYNGALNFQPRVGFAWTPGGKSTVIRGAYTISSYMEGTGTNLRLPLNPPLNQEFETRYDNPTLYPNVPGSTLSDGLTVLSAAGDPFRGTNIRLWDPNVRPAVSKQWNFTIQHQFGNSTTLQVGYVGQHGTHLMVPMPYLQGQLLPDGTVAKSPYLSGNPALSSISQISGSESNGSQRYDALQATFQRRFSNGLQYQIAYTYSKCMTNAIGYYGASTGTQTASQGAYWQNRYNKDAEWGPCFFDQTHSGTSYATYELPVGRDRKFGRDMNPVLNAVVGDWQISGIVSLHTGFPLTINGRDQSGTGARSARANCLAPATVFGRQNSPAGGYQWFDPSVYDFAPTGTFGTCGVGTVRGPGLATLDASLQKIFSFTETVRLQFRGEFINLTNTPILNAPNRVVGATLGQLQTGQGARNIQLGLKLYF